MEPVRQGLKKHHGALSQGIAAGLALRCDHGSQYTSEHFQTELKHFGVRQSLAYVSEPETNGVIERFWKTLTIREANKAAREAWRGRRPEGNARAKKQVIEGRIYQTLADLRKALTVLVVFYNRSWRLEKLGGRTPDEVRQAWLSRQAA